MENQEKLKRLLQLILDNMIAMLFATKGKLSKIYAMRNDPQDFQSLKQLF